MQIHRYCPACLCQPGCWKLFWPCVLVFQDRSQGGSGFRVCVHPPYLRPRLRRLRSPTCRYFVLWPRDAPLLAGGQRFLVDPYGRGGLLLVDEVRGVCVERQWQLLHPAAVCVGWVWAGGGGSGGMGCGPAKARCYRRWAAGEPQTWTDAAHIGVVCPACAVGASTMEAFAWVTHMLQMLRHLLPAWVAVAVCARGRSCSLQYMSEYSYIGMHPRRCRCAKSLVSGRRSCSQPPAASCWQRCWVGAGQLLGS